MSEEIARLYEEAQRRLREVTTLYEASQACLSISDQKELLTAIIEAAARAADATLGSVMLIDKEKGEYVFGAHYGLSPKTIAAIEAELHIPLGEGLVGSVVTTSQPVVVADVSMDPRWVLTETKEPVRSFLGVPLMGRDGQPLGALTLSRPEVGAFDEDHARLLSTFANQAALAIENARLYEQAQQEIIERKQVIEALQESEERFRQMAELSPFAVSIIDASGRYEYVNPKFIEVFGYTLEDISDGKEWFARAYPDPAYRREVISAWLSDLEQFGKYAVRPRTFSVTCKDGTVREVLFRPVTVKDGKQFVIYEDITERKRAEEVLRASEETARALLNAPTESAILLDTEGTILALNETAAQRLDKSVNELVGLCLYDLFSPDVAKLRKERIDEAIRLGKPVHFEDERKRRIFDNSIYPVFDAQEKVAQVAVFAQDITKRKRVEERLRREHDLVARLMETSPASITVVDRQGQITFANNRAEQILGLTIDEITQRTYNAPEWRITDYDGRPFPDEELPFQRVMATSQPVYDVRHAIEWPNGQRVLLSINAAPLFDESGQVDGMVATVEDITDRVRVEEALRRSELQYRTTLDSMGDAIHVVDADLQFVLLNSTFKQWNKELGLEMDVLGRTIFEVFPFLPDRVRDEYQWVFDAGKALITEESTQVGDKEFITETRKIPIFENGRVAQVVTVIRDITERKRAEEALKESEEKFRNLAEQSPNMIFINQKGRVVYANKKCEEIMRHKREEFYSSDFDFFTLIAPESIDLIRTSFSRHMRGEDVLPYEYALITKEGKRIEAIITSKLIRYGGESAILGIVTDITQRKQLEEQLRQAQKMEAIGTLAGGIAHDFNNILTSILGFASVAHSELPADSPLRPDMETIIHSAQRGSELTRQLLTFARRGRVEAHPLSLNDTAREVIKLLERTIDKAIAIEPHLARDLALVEGNAGQLNQMLLNLCLNACDAMPQGGRLIIETQNVTLSEEKARTDLDLEAGRYVLLSVTDTGTGMEAETQQRLFEPFFTTKKQGRGLGLAMVYGIVRGHGGVIHVYSEPGQGSTFKVYLPAASRLAEDIALEEAQLVGGSETVLVVDDEEPVRKLLRRILEQGGYTVLSVTNGVEAVELYAGRSTEIDLVVLDIIMPQMGGRETYERLREVNPGVKVLLSSGYSENGQAQDILAAGARGFLQKPYDLHAVLRKVREALDS